MARVARPLAAVILFCIAVIGCRPYRPAPLDRQSVQRALTPPPMSTITTEARELKHPILEPIAFDDRDGLSPDEAAVLAVLASPALRAERDRRGLAEAQLLQAGLLPNPQLSYSLDVPTGGITRGTFQGYGWGLSWDVAELISRSARVRAASAGREAVDLEIAWQEWQTAQAAKLSVYRLAVLIQKQKLAGESERNLAQGLELLRRAVDAGQATVVERGAAEDAANRARALALDLSRQAEQERQNLVRLLGLPAGTEVHLQDGVTLPDRLDPPAAAALLDGLEDRRLDLVALRKGYESQEETLRAAVLAQFPKINLGLNYARDTSNVITTGFGITIDLPLFDRNQGAIAQETATRQQLFDEYVNRVAEARADIAQLQADIPIINEQVRAAEQAQAGLERLAETYRQALQAGQVDAPSYYGAVTGLNDQRQELVTLKGQLIEARVALELAAGLYRLESEKSDTGAAGPGKGNP